MVLSPAQFRKEYEANQTWGDSERTMRKMSKTELKDFIKLHEGVKKYTGLDMRQEHYLSTAKALLSMMK